MDKYTIGAALGSGQWGVVRKAALKDDNLPVAVKKVRVAGAQKEGINFQVLREIKMLRGVKHAHIVVFAFSQGCHTASRWVGNGVLKPKRMILWGSDPAEDLSPEEWDAVSDVDDIQVVAGTLDRFVTGGKLQRAEEALRDHQCTFEIIRYEGGHHLQDSVLTDLFSSKEDSLEL